MKKTHLPIMAARFAPLASAIRRWSKVVVFVFAYHTLSLFSSARDWIPSKGVQSLVSTPLV
jgi:hypothetical protein